MPEHLRAVGHLAALETAGHRFVISELTRTETLILPLQPGNGHLLQEFFRFFHGPNLRTVSLTAAMHARASAIRGSYTYPALPPAQPRRYGLADALHLAIAIESGCDVFLTNDNQLTTFPDITIEVLP
jgi:predicted nucleic acid-binding protein